MSEERMALWRVALAERFAREEEYKQAFKIMEDAKQRMIEARGGADIARYELETALMKEVGNESS